VKGLHVAENYMWTRMSPFRLTLRRSHRRPDDEFYTPNFSAIKKYKSNSINMLRTHYDAPPGFDDSAPNASLQGLIPYR